MGRHPPFVPAVAVALACALTAAACSGGSGGDGSSGEAGAQDAEAASAEATTTSLAPFDGDDFYAAPDPIPEGDPGTLVRYEEVDDEIAGAQAWRVMYLSRSLEDEPIIVTGTVLIPPGPAPDGGRRILTIAHGTTGIADECAPSHNPVRTELALMGSFVEAGYVVALTDYEGLGTPGRHPYLVGESEGRSVIDAARAARQLPHAEAGDQLAIFGYSQGGHGALWAGQVAADWAPELELVGTVAGAPATELPVIFRAAPALPAVAGFLYMILAGFEQAYPEADLSLVLTPEGEDEMDTVDEGCAGDVIRHFASLAPDDLLRPDAASTEPWADLAEGNDPGRVATDSPILVVHSAADDLVPASLSATMVERMCGLGQVVERRVYDRGQGHGEAVPDAVADGFEWIEARFAGEQPVSTCPG